MRWAAVICAAGVAFWAFQSGMIFLGLLMAYLGYVNLQNGTMRHRIPGGVERD